MQLLGKILSRLRPQHARFHWQRVIQIVYQLQQAFDVRLDYARAVRQFRLRKKTGVDAKLDLERAVRGPFGGIWKFRDGSLVRGVNAGVPLIEFRAKTG